MAGEFTVEFSIEFVTGTMTLSKFIQWDGVSQVNREAVPEHSLIDGTDEDDHLQYALLAGRGTGQTLIGGTASGNNLTLQSTSNASRGSIVLVDGCKGTTVLLGTPADAIASESPIMIVEGSTPLGGDEGVAKIGCIEFGGYACLVLRGENGSGVVVGNGQVETDTFKSNVTTGTAPFTVASTTAVTNLNADRVDGKHYSEILADAIAAAPLPTGFRNALVLQSAADTANDVICYAGKCRDSSDTENIVLAGSITKRLDASWAVGDGNGGLDTGSRASNTWYWIHLIKRTDTGVVDMLFSASPTAPTMPANYDKRRLIGAVRSNASNANYVFDSRIQGGVLFFEYRDPSAIGLDIDTSSLSTTATTYTLPAIPNTGSTLYQTIFFDANVVIDHGSSQAHVLLSNVDAVDNAPSLTAAPLTSIRMVSGGGEMAMRMRLSANRDAQLRARSSNTSTTLKLQVLGFEWPINLGS